MLWWSLNKFFFSRWTKRLSEPISYLLSVLVKITDWWFETWFLFFYWDFYNPWRTLIFFRGVCCSNTNQGSSEAALWTKVRMILKIDDIVLTRWRCPKGFGTCDVARVNGRDPRVAIYARKTGAADCYARDGIFSSHWWFESSSVSGWIIATYTDLTRLFLNV